MLLTGLNGGGLINRNVNPTPNTLHAADEMATEGLNTIQIAAQENQLNKYRKMNEGRDSIDIKKCISGAVVGALIGIILGILIFNNGVNVGYALWGLLLGAAAGFIALASFQIFENRTNNQYRKEADERRAALRRQEQIENEEKHKEYIYYDAATEQGLIYRLLCCPHFGKITSERIIYSAHIPPTWDWSYKGITSVIFYFWRKKVDQVDYDLVLDVGVEQSCNQYLTNVGTVVIHCSTRDDVSVVRDERDKLTRAIEGRNELELKSCIRSAATIEFLRPLIDEAEEILKAVIHKRFEDCQAKNIEFKHIFPHDSTDVNTAQLLYIHDVAKPYMVLDDLSYRITKSKNPSTGDAALLRLRSNYLASITAGDLRVGEEKQIIQTQQKFFALPPVVDDSKV